MRQGVLIRWERKPARGLDTADPVAVGEFIERMRPTIPLDRALLCVECESVFEAEGAQTCPACGSHQAFALGRALGARRCG